MSMDQLSNVLTAISHHSRRAIIGQLAGGPARFTDIAKPFDLSLNAITKHLKLLERAGLISREKQGREVLISFRPEPLRLVAGWVHKYERFWSERLDAFEGFFKEKKEKEAMKPEMKTIELELTRTIPASPIEVFDGWLDPKCPGTPWSMAEKLVLDVKVDGLFYWLFINQAGEHKPHYGRFTILDRPSKVQYTWMSLHTRGLESLVTVTFQKKGEDTLLTLRHQNLPDDEYGRGHEKGWGYLLSQFADRFPRDRDQP